MPDEVMFTVQPWRVMVPPSWGPSVSSGADTVRVAPADASIEPPEPVPPPAFTCCVIESVRPAARNTSPPPEPSPVDVLISCFENTRSTAASRSRSPPRPPAAAPESILPFMVTLPVSEMMLTSAPSPPLCWSELLAAGAPAPSESPPMVMSPVASMSTSPPLPASPVAPTFRSAAFDIRSVVPAVTSISPASPPDAFSGTLTLVKPFNDCSEMVPPKAMSPEEASIVPPVTVSVPPAYRLTSPPSPARVVPFALMRPSKLRLPAVASRSTSPPDTPALTSMRALFFTVISVSEMMVMPPATSSAPGATMVPPSIRTFPALMKRPALGGPEMVRVFVRTSRRAPRSMLSPAAGTVIVQFAAIVQSPAPGAHSCVPPHCAPAGADQEMEPRRMTTRARRTLMGCGGTPGGRGLARNIFNRSAGGPGGQDAPAEQPSGAEAIGPASSATSVTGARLVARRRAASRRRAPAATGAA